MKSKSLLSCFILIFVLLFPSGCASNNSDAKIAELEEKVKELALNAEEKVQSEFADKVEPELEKIQSELAEKEEEVSRLVKENTNLQEDFGNLKQELEESYGKISDLESSLLEKNSVIDSRAESSNKLIDRRNEAGTYYDEKDLLWWLVVKFDEGWIRYINAGDETVFKYVVKDSPIYNMAVDYRKTHTRLKQKMSQIGNQYVEISGDSAKIHVYESLDEISDNGSSEHKEYYWVYSAVKRDNIWYLTEMKRDNS